MVFQALPVGLRRVLIGVGLIAAFGLPALSRAQALAAAPQAKISVDLAAALGGGGPASSQPWARTVNGQLLVRAVVLSGSDDPSLGSLRQFVLGAGGAIGYQYTALRGLSITLPAHRLMDLARRGDVLAIAPNRSIARTGGLLQATTGTSEAAAAVRSVKLDGSGVGIAVLDSGVAASHQHLQASVLGPVTRPRVLAALDLVQVGRGLSELAWTAGLDQSSLARLRIEASLYTPSATLGLVTRTVRPDAYGHGTHVASIAAGRGDYQLPDASGIAPNATVFDVRVLDDKGLGNLADVVAGIDWVIQNAALLNIRVMNLSLAAGSSDSFLIDPLARAARNAVASGIVVVVAAGNAGKTADGREVYGSVGSPGHDPSVITVGATNPKATVARGDDSVAGFSSRGPTRGRAALDDGSPWIDNLVKPDLVAPGNRIVGALAADVLGSRSQWNLLASSYPELAAVPGASQAPNQTLMQLSGTSVAAPVVAGAAALMLQANPGLTPPLVKAILQYTAQPLAAGNLFQQGVGQLNIEGAVRLAAALRSDIGPALAAGRIRPGDPLLATGRTLPVPQSTINGQTFAWGRVITAGGNHLFSGDALHNPVQVPLWTWNSRFCEDQALARQSRNAILSHCAHEHALLMPAHFAPPHAAYIKARGDDFELDWDHGPR